MGSSLTALLAAGSLGIGVLFVVLASLMPSHASIVRGRLEAVSPRTRTLREVELDQPFVDRVLKPIANRFAALGQRMSPSGSFDKLRTQLILAGNPGGLSAMDFVGIQGLSVIAGGTAGILLLALMHQQAVKGFILLGMSLGMGYFYPKLWLMGKVKKRQRSLVQELPDALDLLTIMVEAGLGFDAALTRLVDKTNNTLTEEFAIMISEIRLGKSRRDALRELGNRTNSDDIATLVSALVQADQLGVSVSRVLRIQAGQMRLKRRQRAEEQAHKAPIKMLFPLAFLVFPSMFIIILGPAVPLIMSLGK